MVAKTPKSLAVESRAQSDILRLTLTLLSLLLRRLRALFITQLYLLFFKPVELPFTIGGEVKYNNRQFKVIVWATLASEVVFNFNNYSFLHKKQTVTGVTSGAGALTFSLVEY